MTDQYANRRCSRHRIFSEPLLFASLLVATLQHMTTTGGADAGGGR